MYLYLAIFEKDEISYTVSFPDLPGCLTFGKSMAEALHMAQDALEGYLIVMEDDQDAIPSPSNPFTLLPGNNQIVVPVQANTDLAREKEEAKLIKKTLTIPSYLNKLANASGINFSATLTEALKGKLNL